MGLRVDLVFSYWVFAWYILYFVKLVSYSPKFAILLGIIENTILLLLMIYYGSKPKNILYFVLINAVIKVVPYLTLKSQPIRAIDIAATVALFIFYVLWVTINGESVVKNFNNIFVSLVEDKNETPFMSLMAYLEKYFKRYSPLPNQ